MRTKAHFNKSQTKQSGAESQSLAGEVVAEHAAGGTEAPCFDSIVWCVMVKKNNLKFNLN